MKKEIKQNVFYQYILSYGLIFLIPVLIMFGMSIYSLHHKQQELSSLAEQTFTQSAANMESRFSEIENLTQLIAADKSLADAVDGGYYERYQLFKNLQQYCHTNSMIENIYVFFEKGNRVVGSDGLISTDEYYYRLKYSFSPDDFRKWKKERWNWNESRVSLRMNQVRLGMGISSSLQYSWPVRIGYGDSGEKARIVLYMNTGRLRDLISVFPGLREFSVRMLKDEEPIGLFSDEAASSKKKPMQFEWNSSSGRHYECTVSRVNVYREWYVQIALNILFLGAICVFCVVLSCVLARRNSTPIVNILEKINKNSDESALDEQSVFDYLEGRVSDIIQDRQQLQDELEHRIELLQLPFVERLLTGTLPDYSDLDGQLANLRISLHGDFYCAAVFQIVSYPENNGDGEEGKPLSAARMLVENSLYKSVRSECYIYSMEVDLVAVILAVSEEQIQNGYPIELCRRTADEVRTEYNIRLEYAAGRPYAELADIFLSYMQAKKGLRSPDGNLNTEDMEDTSQIPDSEYYYYPLELEQKLIRVTLSGNDETLSKIFEELKEENFGNRRLSSSMYRRLREELRGTFIKILNAMQEQRYPYAALEQAVQVPSHFSSEHGIDMYSALFLEAALIVRTSKEKKAADYKKRIAAYMSGHYTDPAMSLSMLADYFGMTEVYMSKLFKENMGMLFSQYLENQRMTRAEDLLRNSHTSISTIAENCGYQSPHAFRRAYKRHYGILPSDARPKN